MQVLSLTLVARYRFPKADVKVIVDFLVKEREFNSFYLSLHVQKREKKKKRNYYWDFLGSPVVESLPVDVRGYGFDPWSGTISHASEQQSPCATTTEPAL